MAVWWGVVACTPDDEVLGPPVEPVEVITVTASGTWQSTKVAGAYRYAVTTDVPTTLALAIDDGVQPHVVRYVATTTDHDVPVIGVHPDRDVTLWPTLTDEAGHDQALPPMVVRTLPLDLFVPDFDLLVHRVGQTEPGFTLLPLQSSDASVVVAIDAFGDAVWGFPTETGARGLKLFGEAELMWVEDNRVVHTDVGRTFRTVYGNPDWQSGVDIDVGRGFHHDVWPNDDGTFTALSAESVEVPDYPSDVAFPWAFKPAEIRADVIVTLDRAGREIAQIRLAELLDTRRIGFDGVSDNETLSAWTHANALWPWEGGFVVSLRHQDAVVAIDAGPPATLRWILGHPDGWVDPFAAARLQPVGDDLAWPYHQHAPDLRHTEDGLTMLLFDNGNHARTSPYGGIPHPEGDVSRVVEYVVDEATGTVRQHFEFVGDGTGTLLFSGVMGNADALPQTHHILATYPSLQTEGAVSNRDLGLGDRTTRVIEIDRSTGSAVWDLRVSSDVDTAATGWRGDRAQRLPHLYGDIATVAWP